MSFIGDLLRQYPDPGEHWPRERLLSEATAATLRQVPSLASRLVADVTCVTPTSTVEVSTEHPVGDGSQRVDMQLAVEGGPLVWIEIKYGSPLSGADQLKRYDAALRRSEQRGDPRVLVYLTPVEISAGAPPEVKVRRWQDIGDLVKAFVDDPAPDTSERERWLASDFLDYLKELNLTTTDPVPITLSTIAQEFRSAHEALVRLQTQVDDSVGCEERWTPTAFRRNGGAARVWPEEYWSVYQAVPADAFAGCDFEWVMLSGETLSCPLFCAGMIWRDSSGHPSPLLDSAWVNAMLGLQPPDGFGGFERPGRHIDGNRLYRELPLEGLPQAPRATLADQAEVLAGFVTRSFAMLAEHPPS